MLKSAQLCECSLLNFLCFCLSQIGFLLSDDVPEPTSNSPRDSWLLFGQQTCDSKYLIEIFNFFDQWGNACL